MSIATDLERYMLQLVNEARADQGLRPLVLEQNLNRSADAHSQWLLDNGRFTHDGPNGSNAFDRMIAAGFDEGTSWTWAENLGAEPRRNAGTYFDEVDTIFAGWLASPGHFANMMNANITVIGIGIVEGVLPPQSGANVLGIMATQNFAASNGAHDYDIRGTSGDDRLNGREGDDNIVLLGGNDVVWSRGGHDYVEVGSGNDTVNAGAGNDTVEGHDGNDLLRGAAGNDDIFGDAGNDYLIGDAGVDVMMGGNGNDTLDGGDDNDVISGGGGFDLLQGGNGNDTMDGGPQADNLFASAGDDLLTGGAGFDRLFGGLGEDTLFAGDGPDALFGGAGNDVMFGEEGNDRNYGGIGNDFIQDAGGNDLLQGGAGFDTLDGGAGDDMLLGRFNADRFVFNDIAGGFGNDTIGDFAATNRFERIDFSGVAAITSLDDLLNNHAEQVGGDVMITAGVGSTILLLGVNQAQLDSTDFIF